MRRKENHSPENGDLLIKISQIVADKGLKSTTMDMVAHELGMSKRTLYELFGSKSEMIRETFRVLTKRNKEIVAETFKNSKNVMEALIKVFCFNRDWLQKVNVSFFRDMDRLYKEERESYEDSRRARHEEMMEIYKLGVEQGMFRKDVDFNVQSRIMGIQMESLKRMEEIFPKDISLLRVYDALILGFLRSIASPEGMGVLDSMSSELITN